MNDHWSADFEPNIGLNRFGVLGISGRILGLAIRGIRNEGSGYQEGRFGVLGMELRGFRNAVDNNS